MWVERRCTGNTRSNKCVILLVRMWVERHIQEASCCSLSSSSLWGCELKGKCDNYVVDPETVILWGCELKNLHHVPTCTATSHPPCEDVSWKNDDIRILNQCFVILLVRMWVEKSICSSVISGRHCHPPCEDVSWKNTYWTDELKANVILLVRMWVEKLYGRSGTETLSSSSLWGCELKKQR